MGKFRLWCYVSFLLLVVELTSACGLTGPWSQKYHLRHWEKNRLAGEAAWAAADLKQAERMSLEAVKHAEQLGCRDFHLAMSLIALSRTYTAQGKCDKAEKTSRRALEILDHVLHSAISQTEKQLTKHDRAKALEDLAAAYACQGNYELADKQYDLAIEMYEGWYDREHNSFADDLIGQEMAATLADQGDNLIHLKRIQDAQYCYRRALDVATLTAYSGKQTNRIKDKLIQLLQMQHKDEQANRLVAEEDWKRYAGTGKVFLDQHDWQNAERSFGQALEQTKSFSSDDLRISGTLEKLAFVYMKQGRYDEAAAACEEAVRQRDKVAGANDPESQEIIDIWATSLLTAGMYDQAEPVLKRQLGLQNKLYGSNSSVVADTLVELTRTYHELGQIEKAKATSRLASKIYSNYPIVKKRKLILFRLELARILHDLGDYTGAEPLYGQTLEFYSRKNAPGGVVHTLFELSSLQKDTGQLDKASSSFKEAQKLMEQMGAEDKAYIAGILMTIADRYSVADKHMEAEKWRKLAVKNGAVRQHE